ncbi:MAG: 30S ribosomal protein S20 [Christensenella sp.]|nr:MAG: 30S ribosomal protein S20 [Christensenella sp.]
MPNIKSAKKRVITSEKRNEINTAKKARVKTAIKKYNAAIEAKDVALAEKLLPETISVIDCAFKDGIYKKTRLQERNQLSAALLTLSKHNV